MKTQVIRINQFDNFYSVRDKLQWVQSPKILLFFPERINETFSQIDLLLLNRLAQRQGAQMAIATRSGTLKERAERLGLPFFDTVEEAYHRRWRVQKSKQTSPVERVHPRNLKETLSEVNSFRRAHKDLSFAIRFTLFLVSVFCVAALFWFFIPKATILTGQETQVQKFDLEIQGKITETGYEFGGVIPVHELAVTVDASDSRQTSGSITLPSGKASGQVVLTNLTEKIVEIPAGTILSTLSDTPVRFVTSYAVVVGAGVGGSKTVNVEALEPGDEGNAAAGTVQVVEGALGLAVSANNEVEFSGGAITTIAAPSLADYQILEQDILQLLAIRAEEQINTVIGSNQKILPGSMRLNQILLERGSPPVGEPGELLEMEIQAEYSVWYIETEEISNFGKMAMDVLLPAGFRSDDHSISIEIPGDALVQENYVTWKLYLSRGIEKDLQIPDIIRLIAGRNPDLAANLIQSKYALEKTPEISISPNWWPILPYLGFQYEVKEK